MISTTTLVIYDPKEKIVISEIKPNLKYSIPDSVSVFVGDLNEFYKQYPDYENT